MGCTRTFRPTFSGHDNVGFGHVPVAAETNYEHTESVFGYCYPDDGGCDREVVLRVTTVSTATAHKIEGE
jgi:hypothetical protein